MSENGNFSVGLTESQLPSTCSLGQKKPITTVFSDVED